MVSHAEEGRGMWESTTAVPECDGMVTQEDIGLMCFYADCVPLLFFHPPTGMVGLAHAGWKGTVNKIIREVFKKIREAGGTAQDCFAAIGPCIGSCCYEVGEDVAAVFNENFNDTDILARIIPGKYQLDLVKANLGLLLEEGVPPENISTANLCTSCHNDVFFSYRKERITGRMAAFIMKRKGVK
jgi:YfiH family protein